MAQNIAIQEGNQGKQFGHINKLKISNQGGGTSLWVPEDEVRTKSLYVSENGTYLASKDEVYGYDEVTVNITKEVIGYKYDEDTGEIDGLYDIEVDDDDFFIEDDEGEIGEELPTSIKVVVPPDKTEYIIAEPINTKGMVVKGYYYDGSEYGEIPREEYTIDPLIAPQGSTEGDGERDTTGTTLNSPLYLLPLSVGMRFSDIWIKSIEGAPYGIKVKQSSEGNSCNFAIASYEPSKVVIARKDGSYPVSFNAVSEYTYDGKTAYYSGDKGYYFDAGSDVLTSAPQNQSAGLTAAMALLQTKPLHPEGTAEITVIWDNGMEELTDTFKITVYDPTPVLPAEGDDSGGGSSGGEDPEHPITPHI